MIRVTKTYVDKYTHDTICAGAILEDATPERQKELLEAGVIEVIKEPDPVCCEGASDPYEDAAKPQQKKTRSKK